MGDYENYNNTEVSFRIFSDKLLSNNRNKNLLIESLNNSIELKVNGDENKIIFNNDLVFNNNMDFNNKPLTGLTNLTCSNLNLVNNLASDSNVNIINKPLLLANNNNTRTTSIRLQDLSKSLFSLITIFNNSSILVDINIVLYCSYGYKERITLQLWRDSSMILQSTELGSVNSAGGITIPYTIRYLDENLSKGEKKYYLKYKLERNVSTITQIVSNEDQGISNTSGSSNIILREITSSVIYSNKKIFNSSAFTTTTSDLQDLSAVFFNTIDVLNTNVQISINIILFCCYGINERITIQVWRDLSMISETTNIGTANSTKGLTIPYSFDYLDVNLSNGIKKYYLKYKLENNLSNQEQGIINLTNGDSIGTSHILLGNIPKSNNNVTISKNNIPFTRTKDIQDLSNSVYTNINIESISSVFIDLNIAVLSSYAYKERLTIELWRDSSMISQNLDLGNINATGRFTNTYRLLLLDENVSIGVKKYYLKYKLEDQSQGQGQGQEITSSAIEQGIINVQGSYYNIGYSNKDVLFNILSYTNINGGNYIKNTRIGYNPAIKGDEGSDIGRRDAYFTYIDVNGSDSSFNDSLYVKENLVIGGSAIIGGDLSVNNISIQDILSSLDYLKIFVSNINSSDLCNNRINAIDLSATNNITISNELYSLNKYYGNNLNIGGQLLSSVLRVPNEFTIDPSGFFNNSGTLIINGNLIVYGNKQIIRSSIIDISSYMLKVASNLANKSELLSNPAGLDVSNIASLKYDGTKWNIGGGNLFIGNKLVALDISLINLQRTICNSLIAIKQLIDNSFGLLQTNIDNSFNSLVSYTKNEVSNLFVTKNYAISDFSTSKYYIDISFVTKLTYAINVSNIIQNYVTKAYVDGSFQALNTKLNPLALRRKIELSYNDLSGQFTSLFNSALANADTYSISIEAIKAPKIALASHVSISGDLIVSGDTSSNSLNISNSYRFTDNGYYSVYRDSSIATDIIEQYYSKFNNNTMPVLCISADGSFYNLNYNLGALSDSRLKENIVDASPKLEDLLKVRIVDYNLKNCPNKKYIGVVAQELEELFPALVETETPNAEEIENGKTTKYKTVKYSCFNVMLIKALQEQQQIITNLSLRLERLKKLRKTKYLI
jgi:hypothetical protein